MRKKVETPGRLTPVSTTLVFVAVYIVALVTLSAFALPQLPSVPVPPMFQVAPGGAPEPTPYPDGLFCSEAGIVDATGLVVNPNEQCMCTHTDYSADCDNPAQMAQTPDCKQYCGKPKCHCHVTCAPANQHQGNDGDDVC